MTTRRMFSKLLATSPFLAQAWASPAWAQADLLPVKELFERTQERLSDQRYVYEQLKALGAYVDLLEMAPPNWRLMKMNKPQLQKDAKETYSRVMHATRMADYHFAGNAVGQREKDKAIQEKFADNRHLLEQYFHQLGIVPTSQIHMILETGLVAMMLFYAETPSVKSISTMRWCIFPFFFFHCL